MRIVTHPCRKVFPASRPPSSPKNFSNPGTAVEDWAQTRNRWHRDAPAESPKLEVTGDKSKMDEKRVNNVLQPALGGVLDQMHAGDYRLPRPTRPCAVPAGQSPVARISCRDGCARDPEREPYGSCYGCCA